MKRREIGIGVLRPVILGVLLGVLGATLCIFPQGLSIRNWRQEFGQRPSIRKRPADVVNQKPWPPREFYLQCDWYYSKVDENGWSTGAVGSFQDLDNRLGRLSASGKEIVIPVFPSVFPPTMDDKFYYDAILQSGIKRGDKVLVVGTGSGTDAWAASLKSQDLVYGVDVNPLAIVNTRTTVRLGNFRIKLIVGDIRDVKLPDDFKDFDYVLWNMPFLVTGGKIKEFDFHDGDDGSILRRFLALLPSLLKKDGKAMILNSPAAAAFITSPRVTTKTHGSCTLFVIPNLGVPANGKEKGGGRDH